jgi:tRNA pseudouridine synthase 10
MIKEVTEIARKTIQEGPICDSCLGRQFAVLGRMTNRERGKIIRKMLGLQEENEGCWVCNGLFEFKKIEEWATRAIEKLEDYDYASFLVGTKMDGMRAENEEMLWEISGATWTEPLKSELNREVGKLIKEKTAKEPDFVRPDVVVLLNLEKEYVELQINSLFIYGRYRKLVRGIPQTRWHHYLDRSTKSTSERPSGTRPNNESVEELISSRVLKEFGAGDAILHACGREDVDARMLGSGRPFVLEVKTPLRRYVHLPNLQKEINEANKMKIEVFGLSYVRKGVVEKIKKVKADKVYQLKLKMDGIDKKELKDALKGLVGVIVQRTPMRVAHRRADLVRKRMVHSARVASFDEKIIEISCEGGLYIKELVSGDNDRTKPNLASLLKTDVGIEELDVINVKLSPDALTPGDHAMGIRSHSQ